MNEKQKIEKIVKRWLGDGYEIQRYESFFISHNGLCRDIKKLAYKVVLRNIATSEVFTTQLKGKTV